MIVLGSMDLLDSLHLTRFILSQPDASVELDILEQNKKQIDICIMIIEATVDGFSLSDIDHDFIRTKLAEARHTMSPSMLLYFDQHSWNGKIPPCLQLKNVPGEVPMEKICKDPSFVVRGKHYMKDKKKVGCRWPCEL